MEPDKKDSKEISDAELLELLKKRIKPDTRTVQNHYPPNLAKPPMTMTEPPGPPQPQKQPSYTRDQEKKIIAEMMMKLHKNIMLLCLMLFLTPTILVLISMMNNSIAICIALIIIIYPAYLYMRSMKQQDYLSRKYNLKPFIPFKNQQQQQLKAGEETIF